LLCVSRSRLPTSGARKDGVDEGVGVGEVLQDDLSLGGAELVHAASAGGDRDDECPCVTAGCDVARGVSDEDRGPLINPVWYFVAARRRATSTSLARTESSDP
jgi:hypothetical protein